MIQPNFIQLSPATWEESADRTDSKGPLWVSSMGMGESIEAAWGHRETNEWKHWASGMAQLSD